MSAPDPQVIVEADADELATAVAKRTVDALIHAQRQRGVASLVITGGGILEKTLAQLAKQSDGTGLDWSKVELWWGDERFVAADSPDRNDAAVLAGSLHALGLDPARVHRMPAAGGQWEDVDAAAAAYAQELARAARSDPGAQDGIPTLDVVLLGVGPDGHCASLFPGHPALNERARSVIGVRNSPKPPPARITLSFRTIDTAQHVWFVVSSAEKAPAVASAVGGADIAQTPSAGPRGRADTLWLIDQAASSAL